MGEVMTVLFQRLVDMIEKSAEELAKKCMEEMSKHPGMATYRSCDQEVLHRRIFRVYGRLGQWLSRDTGVEDIAGWFTTVGKKRFQEGYALSEVIQALVILKRELWKKVLKDGLIDNALDLFVTLKLNNDVVLFFDHAFYNVALGYEQEATK